MTKTPLSLALTMPTPILKHSVSTFFADAPPQLAKEMELVRTDLVGLAEAIADEQKSMLKQGFHLCSLRDYQKKTGKRVFVRVLKVMTNRFGISQATAYRRMDFYEKQLSLKPSETVLQAMVATNTPLLTGKPSVDQRVMRIVGPPPKTADPGRAIKYADDVRTARDQVVQRLKGADDSIDAQMLLAEQLFHLQRMHAKLLDYDPRTRTRLEKKLVCKALSIFGIPCQMFEPEVLLSEEKLKSVGRPRLVTEL